MFVFAFLDSPSSFFDVLFVPFTCLSCCVLYYLRVSCRFSSSVVLQSVYLLLLFAVCGLVSLFLTSHVLACLSRLGYFLSCALFVSFEFIVACVHVLSFPIVCACS